jgi:PEP-CTERM motif
MKGLSLIIALCLVGAVSQAQLIDGFGGGSLGSYTLTRILDNGVAEANVTFGDAGGVLGASYGGTLNQAEQVVFLRSDFNLAVGNMLLVDVLFLTQTSQMDFGLAVSATTTPASVGNPTPTDTRTGFNWAAVYARPSQNAVRSASAINGVLDTATGVLTADETTISQLFIERNSSTDFTLGYYNTSATRFVSRTATFTTTDVGTAIGFYADLRSVGGSLGGLDNFRVTVIPEPSSAALLGLGALCLIGRLRRK